MTHGEIIAIGIGLVGVILLMHNRHVSFVNWLLFGAGLLGAGLVKTYLTPYLGSTVDGLSVLALLALALGATFYCQVVQKDGSRFKWLTPAVSLAFGAVLLLGVSAVGQMVLPSGHMPATTSFIQIQHN